MSELPKIDSVKLRLEQLETVRNESVKKAEEVCAKACTASRTTHREAAKAECKEARAKLAEEKKSIRGAYKKASVNWKKILKALESEPGAI